MINFTVHRRSSVFFFFFNDTATTEIYTLSLHDALPIWLTLQATSPAYNRGIDPSTLSGLASSIVSDLKKYIYTDINGKARPRSEEHTSELQSRLHLVCRLLLEKKKTTALLRYIQLLRVR